MSTATLDLTQLEEMDDLYNETTVDNPYEKIPEGTYTAKVNKVELTQSKKENLMLQWELIIIGPTNAGAKVKRNNLLANPENIKWLKKDLTTCGLYLEKLSTLPKFLAQLLDITLEIVVKHKDKNVNVYINKRLDVDTIANLNSENTAEESGVKLPF